MADPWLNYLITVKAPSHLDREQIEEIEQHVQEWVDEQYTEDSDEEDE